MRLIDADELIKAACVKFYTTPYYKHILDLIDNAPTVEEISIIEFKEPLPPVKVQKIIRALNTKPQGKWIKKIDKVGFISHICSECGAEIEVEDPCDNKFCFNCGAKMGGKKNE